MTFALGNFRLAFLISLMASFVASAVTAHVLKTKTSGFSELSVGHPIEIFFGLIQRHRSLLCNRSF